MQPKLTKPGPPGSRVLLARILDQPSLVAAIESLPAAALGRLIEHVGLEDAGEIVALATTQQIRQIFDDDLWRSEGPGRDEAFDASRFTLWLEVMLEAGEAFVASRLVDLPEEMVTLAFCKEVLVINIDEMAISMSSRRSADQTLLEKALESCLCEEIGEYRVISRRHEGWDAVLGVLLALDRDHHDFVARLLERCWHATNEYIADNGGLYDVLTSEEMLEADAAAEREDRRAWEGYVSPSDAASFLASARTTELSKIARMRDRDPIARAYFRGLRTTSSRRNPSSPIGDPDVGGSSVPDADELVAFLREADVLPKPSQALLLEAAQVKRSAVREERFVLAMRQLAGRDLDAHARRMEELAFVANVLCVGCSLEGRGFRQGEAVRAAVATCNLGFAHLTSDEHESETMVLAGGTDRIFRVGWRLLWQEVVMPAANSILSLAEHARGSDGDEAPAWQRAVTILRAAVVAGKPWTARRGMQALSGRIDERTWTALLGLMDECPHFAGDLAGGGAGGELGFLSSGSHLRKAKSLLDRLAQDQVR